MGSKASLRTITWCKFSSKTMQDVPDTIGGNHETYDTMLQEIYCNFVQSVK